MTSWPYMSMATGPGDVTVQTLRDHIRPMVHYTDPAFMELFERTTVLLQQVYRTRNDVVIMQGETVLGMEAVAASLVSPGDRVLALSSGLFGRWFRQLFAQSGAETIEVAVPDNEAIQPEDVRRALRQHRGIKVLSVIHCETPSGTINPVAEICKIAAEFGVLTVVDASLSLAGEALFPDTWGIDVAVAGPQKCLGGVPGLALLAVSPRAWEALERRTPPLRESYLSLLDWRESWIAHRRFPYTPSVSLVYALESVLTQVLEVGLDRYVGRHAIIGRACRAGIQALGLELWPVREAIATNAVTAVHSPEGVPGSAVVAHLRERYGVKIAGGYREMADRVIHLGHMGPSAHPARLAALLALLERTLADLGVPVRLGAGVGAAMAVLADWS
ncbi:MAG: alanine--glyoxylate aminotransferase family protein [bacterium]|nr:alanine--glyoxylate aminotransferase family protein [bacterium]